jgi:signal peptidase I
MPTPITPAAEQAAGPTAEAEAAGARPRRWRPRRWSLRSKVVIGLVLLTVPVVGATGWSRAGEDVYQIPSGSMTPALQIGDRLRVEHGGTVRRGDVVVFHLRKRLDVRGDAPAAVGVDGDRRLVRRVLGLPGDRLSCAGGRLLRDGAPVAEPYLAPRIRTDCDQVTVGPGQLWVLGDRRPDSADSRVWGPVDQADVSGVARTRVGHAGRRGPIG